MNEKDYKEILAKLTLDEKITMLSGSTNWLTQPVKRDDIDIPAVRMSDGPSGLRREKIGGGVNIMQTPEPATCFPGAVTTASSWDERSGTSNRCRSAIFGCFNRARPRRQHQKRSALRQKLRVFFGRSLPCGAHGRRMGARRARKERRHVLEALSCKQPRIHKNDHRFNRGRAYFA